MLFTSREVRIGKNCARGLVLKTEGTVFPYTDRPSLVNNIFIFFYNTTKGVRKTRTFWGCNHGKVRDKLNNF